MLARAEEVASPSSVLETEALLLNYALMKQLSGSRESNSRDRFGRPQPRHSARPASNFGRRSWTRTKEVTWDYGFTDRRNCCSAKRRIGTSLTNRTPFVAVRSRNAGSTGRGVMLCGALPTESNLVFSRLQGERRRIWLEGRIRQQPVSEHKRLTNVSLATGDRHARTHTCHRWPVCCCYPVVKELRTQRRCAGPLLLRTNKRPGCLRDPGLGHSTEAALTR